MVPLYLMGTAAFVAEGLFATPLTVVASLVQEAGRDFRIMLDACILEEGEGRQCTC